MMRQIERPPLAALNKEEYHGWLVERMAQVVGANIAEFYKAAPGGKERLVVRCMGCQHSSACSAWLDKHAEGAAATPLYCRNSETLAAHLVAQPSDDRASEPKILEGSPNEVDEGLIALIQSLCNKRDE